VAHRVLIPQEVAQEGVAWLREKGYEVQVGPAQATGSGAAAAAPAIAAEDVARADAILLRTALLPAELLEAGERLKVVSRHGVGVDNIDVRRAEELGIWVAYTPESNADTVAEHTLGLMIAAARNLSLSERELRRGNFAIRNRRVGVDLKGKVLGILGVGRVGRRLARKAALGLEMKVIGYDPVLPADRFPEWVERVAEREDLLRRADFVSIHMPSTEETRGSVGAPELEKMKPTSYLINTARGDIVVEEDLCRALENGAIAGAALDVFAEEPPSPDNPLFALDNVKLTPHHAALTRECMIRMALDAARGIDEVLSGGTPTWAVNRPPNPRARLSPRA